MPDMPTPPRSAHDATVSKRDLIFEWLRAGGIVMAAIAVAPRLGLISWEFAGLAVYLAATFALPSFREHTAEDGEAGRWSGVRLLLVPPPAPDPRRAPRVVSSLGLIVWCLLFTASAVFALAG